MNTNFLAADWTGLLNDVTEAVFAQSNTWRIYFYPSTAAWEAYWAEERKKKKNWGQKLKSKCWTASYTICIDKVSAVGYFKAPLGDVCNAMPKWPWGFPLWSQGKGTRGMITARRGRSLWDLSFAGGIDDKSLPCMITGFCTLQYVSFLYWWIDCNNGNAYTSFSFLSRAAAWYSHQFRSKQNTYTLTQNVLWCKNGFFSFFLFFF